MGVVRRASERERGEGVCVRVCVCRKKEGENGRGIERKKAEIDIQPY